MTWSQQYAPLGSVAASALLAALPPLVLLALLASHRVRAATAALAALAAAITIAIVGYGMPTGLALRAAGYGAAYGLFPIGWIIIGAVALYDVTVMTGSFALARRAIAALVDDRRLQVIVIAFAFGAFVEGAAGFGAPVAVTSAMLIGLGFPPLRAAVLALVGNTAPVAFGSMGTPIIALAQVTGLPLADLSAMAGRQLPFFAVLVPFWLVGVLAGVRAIRDVWPACLVSGVAFACTQALVSHLHGPWLVDMASAVVALGALLALLRVWRPATTWRLPDDAHDAPRAEPLTPAERRRAWGPWVTLAAVVFVWGLPQTKTLLNELWAPVWHVDGLHRVVQRMPPAVTTPVLEEAALRFNLLSATGTAMLVTALVSGLGLGLRPAALLRVLGGALLRTRLSLLTIAAMLALGFVTRYAGIDTTLGLALASTGGWFPFFSPIIGWLGVALTGSDTSSNVLFGNLQQVTAQQVGVSPLLAAAANSTGGVMGKMIDAQSIVVSGVATGDQGSEGRILRAVLPHSVVLVLLVALFIAAQAYLFPAMIVGR